MKICVHISKHSLSRIKHSEMSHPKPRRNASACIRASDDPYNPEDFPPRFSFRFLIRNSDFGFESLNGDSKIALINTLHKLSQLTWTDIRLTHRHGLGYEKIKTSALNFELPQGVSTDYLIVFRFCGKAPMLGYRSLFGTLYIIAFDTKFKAYKHE